LTRELQRPYNRKQHEAESFTLFKNLMLVSVHVTDALWASVNDAYVKASCVG